ncbi:PLP-dependent transferase [Ferroacidibacillus organovorans]|uniref:Cystathionine gamma-synthase n=1 Tax=Ferroacidibacillus organovorans TaxID=1765683 RepID=A0A162T9B9_9BACL|nr:PLP-dependent transferase [Ferroacidibacillus organovorans]KYP80586.1 cystathionine gamma-synthase [Ferroacidibacillus organovorans]OAG92899.1 cystathionine gamma-synthase [Ferroacidibacillus organovorans]OPG15850.1 cystathionine gamma-synthase [Ferroacidibacillus organovorans]
MDHIETKLAQLGARRDASTGAIVSAVHRSTTYAHPRLGESTGFDYARTANPTRQALEDGIALLEGGERGFAFSSGMAAISCVMNLFGPGDHVIASNDLYGGTYRLFEQVLARFGVAVSYLDFALEGALEQATTPQTKALFIETPTNPTMKITDLAACIAYANEHGMMTIVDNTFMTPYMQKPLTLGADIVLHSASKYLGGHNDLLAGLVVARTKEMADRLYFYQNTIGAVLGPDDSYLLMRGMKTLGLRMQRHEENAQELARFLDAHPLVERVYYPGLASHPGKTVQERQASGYGGMVSFDVIDERMVAPFLERLQLIAFAESLGGVESLLTFPARQTHADIPEAIRSALGITNRLLRFSVGIEHSDDLTADLAQALEVAGKEVHAR